MGFKLGTLNHAKGFIVHKLWKDRRIGEKHLPVDRLKKGYPNRWRHLIDEGLRCLRAEGCVRVVPRRTGRDSADHVSLVYARLGTVPSLRINRCVFSCIS